MDKIDIDMFNWSFVALRFFLYDLYYKVSGFIGYRYLKEYFENVEEKGCIFKGFKEKFDLEFLNS